MKNRAGTYTKNFSGESEYFSFVPSKLPPLPPIIMDEDMIGLLLESTKKLTQLESESKKIPSVNQFIAMYVRKEALMSSQIEGTQATLEDVLDPTIHKNINIEVSEVINYVNALEYATKRLTEIPLCNRLIKETHAFLMSGIRGADKNPGEFRASQNWIGGIGSTLKNAGYIPPNLSDMHESIYELEKYINDDNSNPLINAALIYYQFETIHPFLDGNGRVGRLLIILYFIEKKVISIPSLYISYFLKKNRIEYYDRMNDVRDKGNYEGWIKFFLKAIIESASDALNTIDKLNELKERNNRIISELGRQSNNIAKVLIYLESSPIVEIKKLAGDLKMAYNTAFSSINRLIDVNIVKQYNNSLRNKTYVYLEYIDILKEGTENY